ncbi:LIM domain-containing protein WLIM1-like [Primulina tabacum]|uniref:LIM domain-containing protein WLIM1-like n=1 Tax=Primulina tabacum TaxID=48773 RepID=UPI003F5A2B97
MATFAGTTQKCKDCEKTVYLVDQLTADSRVYHKACFRCHHCRGTLKLSNYCSYEGVLYCKPHYDQLFKMTGSLDKSFDGGPKTARADRSSEQGITNNSKLSSLFAGTQDKCVSCNKKVYPLEKVAVDGSSYHRSCFKCSHGGCVISPSNYVAHEHQLYCRHHHTQLFKQKGNFSGLAKQEHVKAENGTA